LAGIIKSETKFLVFRTALGFSEKFFTNSLRINEGKINNQFQKTKRRMERRMTESVASSVCHSLQPAGEKYRLGVCNIGRLFC
jgi:hypothetical protein